MTHRDLQQAVNTTYKSSHLSADCVVLSAFACVVGFELASSINSAFIDANPCTYVDMWGRSILIMTGRGPL
jgi:hypothetical protein